MVELQREITAEQGEAGRGRVRQLREVIRPFLRPSAVVVARNDEWSGESS